MKVVIATKNNHKLREFKRILTPLGYEVLSQQDVKIDIDVEENADTFEGNSMLKAKAIYNATKMITIADDSGLEIDYLNGEPGVYSARYGGEGKNDKDRCNLVLQKLKGVSKEKRNARFVCAISMILSENDVRTYKGVCNGYIADDFVGDNGFGYDPIFMVNDKDSFATLDGIEKDKLSHRGKALRLLEEDLKNNK